MRGLDKLTIVSEGGIVTSVELNGLPFPVRKAVVKFASNHLPVASVEMDVDIVLTADARVYLGPETFTRLIELGWTPPAGKCSECGAPEYSHHDPACTQPCGPCGEKEMCLISVDPVSLAESKHPYVAHCGTHLDWEAEGDKGGISEAIYQHTSQYNTEWEER